MGIGRIGSAGCLPRGVKKFIHIHIVLQNFIYTRQAHGIRARRL
jgi:hypothetical protein